MKRRFIALVLTVTTILACFSMTLAAEEETVALPTVLFGGHQRTAVASETYGIRMIGLIDNLNAEEVGFDIALVKNDGTMATVHQPVQEVYTSLYAKVNGVDTEITAASLGSTYLFGVVIPDVKADLGFIGYLCSVYYVLNGEKVSGETHSFIYNNADLYGAETVRRVFPTFERNENFDWEHKEGAHKYMWNGKVEDGDFYSASKGVGVASVAKFNEPTVISKVTLVSGAWYQPENEGVRVQASVDGETWTTLATVNSQTAPGFVLEKNTWNTLAVAGFEVEDSTAYNYIRVVAREDGESRMFSLSEVEVYTKETVPYEISKVTATHTDSTGAGVTGYDYNGKTLDALWNGDITPHDHATVWRKDTAMGEAFSAATLNGKTKIEKITVYMGYYGNHMGDLKIQASADNGATWVTLFEIAKSGNTAWSEENAAILKGGWLNPTTARSYYISDNTEYTNVRVIGSTISLAEVEVYGASVSYSDARAAKMNTKLG